MKKKRIQICISAYLESEWVKYSRRFVKCLLKSEVHDFIDYKVTVGPYIEQNRNRSVDPTDTIKKNLNPMATHYLHLDIGNEATEEQIYQLCAHDEDIIGAVYPKNNDPERLCTLDKGGYNHPTKNNLKGVHEVKGIGLGTLLIDATVYRRLDKPWYTTQYVADQGKLIFLNEDFLFCHKAYQAGFKVKADFDIVIKHRTDNRKSFQL